MPYTAKQKRLFQAAAHNPKIAKKKGMSRATASKLYHESKKQPVKTSILRK